MSIYPRLHLLGGVLLISVVASVWPLAVMVFFRQYDDTKLDTKLERNMRRHNITRVQSACWVLLLTVLERLIHCTSLLYYDTVQSSFSVHSEISVLFTSWSVNVSSFPGDQPPPLRAKNIPCFSKETGQKRTAVWIRKFRSCITWSIYDKDHMSELRIFTQGSTQESQNFVWALFETAQLFWRTCFTEFCHQSCGADWVEFSRVVSRDSTISL